MKLNRDKFGKYLTLDGRYRVWREPYPPRRWFVNELIEGEWGDAFPADGFETLTDARAYLDKECAK